MSAANPVRRTTGLSRIMYVAVLIDFLRSRGKSAFLRNDRSSSRRFRLLAADVTSDARGHSQPLGDRTAGIWSDIHLTRTRDQRAGVHRWSPGRVGELQPSRAATAARERRDADVVLVEDQHCRRI